MDRSRYLNIQRRAIESACLRSAPADRAQIFASSISETGACSDSDVAELIWRTSELFLFAGIGRKIARDLCTNIIADILTGNDFDILVAELPEGAASEIKIDLQILGGW
jgi:hypothetical protein